MVKTETVTKVLPGDVRPGSRYEDNIHPANKLYKQYINIWGKKYHRIKKDDKAGRKSKDKYALELYNQVVTGGGSGKKGRFLKKKLNQNGSIIRYQVMSQSEALKKIHIALNKSKGGSHTSTGQRKHRTLVFEDDEADDAKHVSRQEMSRLTKQIAESLIDQDVKVEMKFAKGAIEIKRKKKQRQTVQSRTEEIEELLAGAYRSEQEMKQLKQFLKGLNKDKEQIDQDVKEREEVEQVIAEEQAIDPSERVALAAQRELTNNPNLSSVRKANLRAVIKKLSENDPLMTGTVHREWQANPSSRWLSSRALDNTMTVCYPSAASVRAAGFARMPSVREENDEKALSYGYM